MGPPETTNHRGSDHGFFLVDHRRDFCWTGQIRKRRSHVAAKASVVDDDHVDLSLLG